MDVFGDGLISTSDVCLPFGKKVSMSSVIHVIVTCYYCFYLKVEYKQSGCMDAVLTKW